VDVVAHTCEPSTREAEAGDCKFEASLDYILRALHTPDKKKVLKWREGQPNDE
jgi:hypothetical protein